MKQSFTGYIKNGKLEIDNKSEIALAMARLEGKCVKVTLETHTKQRTLTQNNALHLYFKLVAETFQEAGYDARMVFKPEAEIPITEDMVKELMWKTIQKAITKKNSTNQLSTGEVSQIYDIMNRHISEKFGLHIPFPSYGGMLLEKEKK